MGAIALVTMVALCFLCGPSEGRGFREEAPLRRAAKPYVVHHDAQQGGELRSEDVMVDPQNNKLTILNWNHGGKDATGPAEAVLDYNKNVAGIVVPEEETCFVMENLSEIEPEEEAIQQAKVGNTGRKRAAGEKTLFTIGEELTTAELNELPEETRALCGQWAVRRIRPITRGESGGRSRRSFFCILNWCF